jgi:hypothetical protein
MAKARKESKRRNKSPAKKSKKKKVVQLHLRVVEKFMIIRDQRSSGFNLATYVARYNNSPWMNEVLKLTSSVKKWNKAYDEYFEENKEP